MGVADTVLKHYFSDKDRLADIFNYYCFDGETIIQPEEVKTQDREESIVITEENHKSSQLVERIRDILAVAEKDGTVFVLLGVENQDYIHYGMPVRNMLYDSLTYAKQIEEKTKRNRTQHRLSRTEFLSGLRKGEKLTPVVTLVLYYGSEPWDGPLELSDMLDMEQVPAKIRPYIQSQYHLNLLEIRKLTDFNKFHTDIREVFQLMACEEDKDKMRELIEANEGYRHLPYDAAQAIAVLTSSHEMTKYMKKEKEGKVNMCKAIDDMILEGEARGKAIGEKQAKDRGIQIFILDNLEENIPHDRIRVKLQRRYDLTPEMVEQYFKEYASK